MSGFTEVEKLQLHLQLLREEYVKLQSKYVELEKKYQVALAAGGKQMGEDNFVSRLLLTIGELFGNSKYRYQFF